MYLVLSAHRTTALYTAMSWNIYGASHSPTAKEDTFIAVWKLEMWKHGGGSYQRGLAHCHGVARSAQGPGGRAGRRAWERILKCYLVAGAACRTRAHTCLYKWPAERLALLWRCRPDGLGHQQIDHHVDLYHSLISINIWWATNS